VFPSAEPVIFTRKTLFFVETRPVDWSCELIRELPASSIFIVRPSCICRTKLELVGEIKQDRSQLPPVAALALSPSEFEWLLPLCVSVGVADDRAMSVGVPLRSAEYLPGPRLISRAVEEVLVGVPALSAVPEVL